MKKRWVLLLAICILSLYTVVGVSSAVDAAEVDGGRRRVASWLLALSSMLMPMR